MSLTVIVKPTHNCNLRCKYCYVPDSAEQGLMDDITLANTIEKTVKYVGKVDGPDNKNPRTHFIWHGGEPLLMGINFFQKIVDIENPL